jgi:hypothetical protein
MLIGRMTLMAAGALTAASLTTLSVPAFAQGSLQDQMAVCARISKSSARIECYDSVASSAGQAAPSSGFGASSIRTPSAAPMAPAAPAGPVATAAQPLSGAAIPGNADKVQVTVASSTDNGLLMWRFALADGAVWRMTERDSMFRPPAPNETVTIRKGSMGSYLMDVGKQASVRVERIR